MNLTSLLKSSQITVAFLDYSMKDYALFGYVNVKYIITVVLLYIRGGLTQGPSQIPKSEDSQVPSIKWPNTDDALYPQFLHQWIQTTIA